MLVSTYLSVRSTTYRLLTSRSMKEGKLRLGRNGLLERIYVLRSSGCCHMKGVEWKGVAGGIRVIHGDRDETINGLFTML